MNEGILLLFLSKRNGNSKEKKYLIENDKNGKDYEGIQTDDAPVKYLIDCAASNGEKISKLLYIVTQEVKADRFDEEFQKMVTNYIIQEPKLKELYKEKMPQFCQIEYNEYVEETAKRAANVYSQVAKELLCSESANVYIDYTGGLRDISFLMTVITRYMEYMNFSCKKIVYSNLRKDNEKGRLHSIDCVYDLFTLINGVDQFVRTGNAELLEKCYESEKDEETRNLLSLIVRFSQVISICNIQELDQLLPKIGTGLQNYGKNITQESLYLRMFADMIEIIRKKLYIKEDASLTYQDLIRWCLDNNMVQQALTLYIEKMPVYYYEKKLLNLPKNLENPPFGTTKEVFAFYTRLFDDRLVDKKMVEFKEALSTIDVKSETFSLEDLTRRKKNVSSECRKAMDRLITFLKKYYVNGVQKRNRTQMMTNPFGKKDIEAKDAAAFINKVRGTNAGAYYFLYNEEYKKPSKEIYKKKLEAIEKVRSSSEGVEESNVKRETLCKMMTYYCALKLIRNRINHASENNMSLDEQTAAEILKKRNNISVEVEFNNVKKLILEGLKAHIE